MRVAICGDFPEEGWPSMDRVAAMLHDELARRRVTAECVCPAFTRLATVLPAAGTSRLSFNADRILNRFWTYPRQAKAIGGDYDVFHIVDHSYAHLVHALPAERTVVTCHDLDTFRSVLRPDEEPRSAAFRRMTRLILAGLQRAASVTCDTAAIRDELADRGIVPLNRLVVAPLGVSDAFSSQPDIEADRQADLLTESPADTIELLHVGSNAPRKRIDVLLRVIAAVRRELADVRLIRIGDALTPAQRQLATELGIVDAVITIPWVGEQTLAALYRRAALVLQPSEREGFGLPIVEALASGTPVVASDIPVLREVGGTAIEYCPVAAVDAWRTIVLELLRERRDDEATWDARRAHGRAHARQFTWDRFADQMIAVYRAVASRPDAVQARRRAVHADLKVRTTFGKADDYSTRAKP